MPEEAHPTWLEGDALPGAKRGAASGEVFSNARVKTKRCYAAKIFIKTALRDEAWRLEL